jgi:hypothetical protein
MRASPHGSRKSFRVIGLISVLLLLMGVVTTALAVPVAGFEIDGDLVADADGEVDWAPTDPPTTGATNVIDAVRDPDDDNDPFTQSCTQTVVSGYESATLICDDVKSDQDTHEGGDKEEDPAGWVYQPSQVTPKTDITNVYALGLIDENNDNAPVLVNALERLPKAGSLNLDFEYNQDVDDTTGIPNRMENDVLVAINLGGKRANDASALNVQLFVAGPGGVYDFANPDVDESGDGTLSGNGITAEINSATIDSGPWQSFDDQYNLVDTLPAFAFAEVAVDLEEAAGLTNVCLNNVTVRSRASESVTAQLKDTTLPQPFEFCGGLAVEKYIDVDESGTENTGDVVDETSDTRDDLDGWAFTIYEGSDTTGTEVCSGTTDAAGALSTCLDGNDNEVDLTTLAPGNYTIQEGTPTSGFFNTDPGTTSRTKPASVTVGGTTTVKFGNACFIDKKFRVTNVPSDQSGLFAYYEITTDSDGNDVMTPTRVEVALTETSSGSGVYEGSENDKFTLKNVITWGFGINQDTSNEQDVEVATGEGFADNGYDTDTNNTTTHCAKTNSTTFPTSTVQGSKFKDKANLGVKDNDEGDAPAGVVFAFELYEGHDADPSTATKVADATYDSTDDSDGTAPSFGQFQFTGIAPGNYTLVEADPPTNWVETFPTAGAYNVTVELGDTTVSTDTSEPAAALEFGNAPEASFTVDFNDLTGFTDATIDCEDSTDTDVGSQTGDTYTSDKLLVGTYDCVIVITDP